MNAQEILSKVDHTLLKQTATWEDIKGICEEAVKYHTATVMIPSCFITKIRENYGVKLKIATVVGFPNGNCNTAAKIAETAQTKHWAENTRRRSCPAQVTKKLIHLLVGHSVQRRKVLPPPPH